MLKEEGMFCCGGTLIPKDHALYGTVFPGQPNATYAAPVVGHLYFARAEYPPVFATTVERKMFSQFATS